jgi:hypothetical protein
MRISYFIQEKDESCGAVRSEIAFVSMSWMVFLCGSLLAFCDYSIVNSCIMIMLSVEVKSTEGG